jgi:alpha-D-xyloside xylohydrolase
MGEHGAELQNEPVDVSEEFARQQNHFFIGSKVSALNPEAASGKILWKGIALKQRVSYHQLTLEFEDYKTWWDTPPGEYEDEQTFPFSLSFITSRTVRLRVAARPESYLDEPSLMLEAEPPTGDSWTIGTRYASSSGTPLAAS